VTDTTQNIWTRNGKKRVMSNWSYLQSFSLVLLAREEKH